MSATFRCYLVNEEKQGSIRELPVDALPAGDVLIRAHYSSLNYKDALAATGHPGVARTLPHVPGIDVAGVVEATDSNKFKVGDEVFVTGYELGAPRWGGWSELVRVPSEWVIPLPSQLTLRDVMILGTAGFTAAQCVTALQLHGVMPDRGEMLVTGASGGVGSLSVGILAKLGYRVAAVTGKENSHDRLTLWGANRILPREAIDVASEKTLLKARWAGAIDTVGGNVLAAILKETAHRGCVAACGNVAGVDLPLTVFPFILRGVKLDGIDSAQCPWEERNEIWEKLSTAWLPKNLSSFATEVALSEVAAAVETILLGGVVGRTVVDVRR